jgi:hypothetical protein
MLVNFPLLWQNNWDTQISENDYLDHGFRGFNLWSLGSICFGPVVVEYIMAEACGRTAIQLMARKK